MKFLNTDALRFCAACSRYGHISGGGDAVCPHPRSLAADCGGCCDSHLRAKYQQTQGHGSNACQPEFLQDMLT